MATEAETVSKAISEKYVSAKPTDLNRVAANFLGGSVYYVEFKKPGIDPNDAFCYVFVTKTGSVETYDDCENLVMAMKAKLDARRNLLQRLNEFSLAEMIGAVIALVVTGAFVFLSLSQGALHPDFVGIFSLIAGYYFGKNIG